MIQGKVDVLVVSETKIYESFPKYQLKIDSFSTPFRLDRLGRYYYLYQIRYTMPDIEMSTTWWCWRFIPWVKFAQKRVLFAGYNPKKERIFHFLENIGTLDKFIETFDNLLLIGDFNSEVEEEDMKEFCEIYNLVYLIKIVYMFYKCTKSYLYWCYSNKQEK